MALVVEALHPQTGAKQVLAVGRLSKLHGRNEAEFGLLVSDHYHHQGIGTEVLRRLVQIGKQEGLERITADILSQNSVMQRVCAKVGFHIQRSADFVRAEIAC